MVENGRNTSKAETTKKKEGEIEGEEMLFLIQRHGVYDNRRPTENMPKEELAKLGLLTEDGEKDVLRKARAMAGEMMASSEKPVDFLVLNSPTKWLGGYGARALHSAEFIAAGILLEIERREMYGDAGLIVLSKVKGRRALDHKLLSQADIFKYRRYFNELRESATGGDWLDAYTEDDLGDLREEEGAESPEKVAERVTKTIKVMSRWGRKYLEDYPNRNLVIWMVTHSEVIRPFVQYELGVGDEASGYLPAENEAIELNVGADGIAVTEFKGREYTLQVK